MYLMYKGKKIKIDSFTRMWDIYDIPSIQKSWIDNLEKNKSFKTHIKNLADKLFKCQVVIENDIVDYESYIKLQLSAIGDSLYTVYVAGLEDLVEQILTFFAKRFINKPFYDKLLKHINKILVYLKLVKAINKWDYKTINSIRKKYNIDIQNFKISIIDQLNPSSTLLDRIQNTCDDEFILMYLGLLTMRNKIPNIDMLPYYSEIFVNLLKDKEQQENFLELFYAMFVSKEFVSNIGGLGPILLLALKKYDYSEFFSLIKKGLWHSYNVFTSSGSTKNIILVLTSVLYKHNMITYAKNIITNLVNLIIFLFDFTLDDNNNRTDSIDVLEVFFEIFYSFLSTVELGPLFMSKEISHMFIKLVDDMSNKLETCDNYARLISMLDKLYKSSFSVITLFTSKKEVHDVSHVLFANLASYLTPKEKIKFYLATLKYASIAIMSFYVKRLDMYTYAEPYNIISSIYKLIASDIDFIDLGQDGIAKEVRIILKEYRTFLNKTFFKLPGNTIVMEKRNTTQMIPFFKEKLFLTLSSQNKLSFLHNDYILPLMKVLKEEGNGLSLKSTPDFLLRHILDIGIPVKVNVKNIPQDELPNNMTQYLFFVNVDDKLHCKDEKVWVVSTEGGVKFETTCVSQQYNNDDERAGIFSIVEYTTHGLTALNYANDMVIYDNLKGFEKIYCDYISDKDRHVTTTLVSTHVKYEKPLDSLGLYSKCNPVNLLFSRDPVFFEYVTSKFSDKSYLNLNTIVDQINSGSDVILSASSLFNRLFSSFTLDPSFVKLSNYSIVDYVNLVTNTLRSKFASFSIKDTLEHIVLFLLNLSHGVSSNVLVSHGINYTNQTSYYKLVKRYVYDIDNHSTFRLFHIQCFMEIFTAIIDNKPSNMLFKNGLLFDYAKHIPAVKYTMDYLLSIPKIRERLMFSTEKY